MEEKLITSHEIDQYKAELWMSLEQFEKTLHNRTLACEGELKVKTIQFNDRIDGLKSQAAFRIEALESALN
jgi:hypothetical protein